ncbi:MAG TPA: glycoside hydrolase family 2 TIM barrel-domain containing protein [Acidimicrobiales bacterium]|nr:glycoside hydrolase family 2 TIM barrel-domain containing protein [Acidimicrobiales bacterium]
MAAAALVLSGPVLVIPSASAPAGGAPTDDAPYLDGVSGPVATTSVDLAGTWGFQTVTATNCIRQVLGPETCTSSPDPQTTTIQVPGGGWSAQGFPTVSEAIYTRRVTIPSIGSPQTTLLSFGAIGAGATLRVDDQLVGTSVTSGMPATFDITRYTAPGFTYTIALDVKGTNAFINPAGYLTTPFSQGQGIYRSARLEAFPAVYVSDAFVRPSVAKKSLSYDVSITNTSSSRTTTTLSGTLRSWNRRPWPYPALPHTTVSVPAHGTVRVTVGPVPWSLGAQSYWWPDVPYVAGYRAQLHDLNLELSTPGEARAHAMYRFGFRQIDEVGDHFDLNGIRVNFRGDDTVDRANDAFDTVPSYLAPTASNPGFPKMVDNYLRLNYNDIRVHQYAASPYMLDVTDEMGLMVLDETGIYGSGANLDLISGLSNMEGQAQDLVRRDRNHASVLRWSQANEPYWFKPNLGAGKTFDQLLYQSVMSVDPTRPISTDAFDVYNELPFPNYTVWCHYAPEDPSANPVSAIGNYTDNSCRGAPGKLPGKPYGQGEFIWPADSTKQGFEWFATATQQLRRKGASDIRPYTLVDAWPSLLPGVTAAGVVGPNDPWSNPQIQRVQDAFSPLLVADEQYWEANKLSNQNGDWPAAPVILRPATPAVRTLEVYNDTFSGTEVDVDWSLHQGSAEGHGLDGGMLRLSVPLGSHVTDRIHFTTPTSPGSLILVLSASKPGSGRLFNDPDTTFIVPAGG